MPRQSAPGPIEPFCRAGWILYDAKTGRHGFRFFKTREGADKAAARHNMAVATVIIIDARAPLPPLP
jgi:hypothetical protein